MTKRFTVEVRHTTRDEPGTPGWYWRVRYRQRQAWSEWIGPFSTNRDACLNAAEEAMIGSEQ